MTDTLYLVARLGGRCVAIPAAQVDSVVEIGTVVPVPGATAAVAGLAALRSRVVTVVDTSAALGLPRPQAPPAHAIITRIDGHHYAMLVDALEDVAAFACTPIAAGVARSGWSLVGRGVIERDGAPVLVADLAALIPALTLAA